MPLHSDQSSPALSFVGNKHLQNMKMEPRRQEKNVSFFHHAPNVNYHEAPVWSSKTLLLPCTWEAIRGNLATSLKQVKERRKNDIKHSKCQIDGTTTWQAFQFDTIRSRMRTFHRTHPRSLGKVGRVDIRRRNQGDTMGL